MHNNNTSNSVVWVLRVVLFACLWMGGGASGWATQVYASSGKVIGDIEIKQEPLLTQQKSYHGYVEYRFSVRNNSPNQTHSVRLTMLGRSQRQHHLQRLSRTVVVGPGNRVIVSLMQPALTLVAYTMSVSVDGGAQEDTMQVQNAYRYYSHHSRSGRKVVLLLGQQLNGSASVCQVELRKRLPGNRYKKSYNMYQFECQAATVPTIQWSKSWMAYTRFDGVMLQASDLNAMPAAVRLALFRYVESGGVLAVLGAWKPPEHWPSTGKQSSEDNRSYSTTVRSYYPGFGKVILFANHTELSSFASSEYRSLSIALRDSFRPFEKVWDIAGANSRFPVIENLKIPVRGIFLVMLLFSLAIGPFNLWLLWRKRKRIMMLVTVPTAALLTCVLVFTYALFSEGWYGYQRITSVTILDQHDKRATTIGWTAYYMPLTPGEGLRFSYNTELTPQLKSHYWRYSGRGMAMDWGQAQQLSSGWIASRLPLHLKFRRSQLRRERLVVTPRKDGTIRVTNGLGKEIRRLWLADHKGRLFRLQMPLAPGAARTLSAWRTPEPKGKKLSVELHRLRALFHNSWLNAGQNLTETPAYYLRPGTYIAALQRSPFVDSHPGLVKSVKEKAVVFGIWGGSGHGS